MTPGTGGQAAATGFLRSPSLPFAVLVGITPALAAAQFRAMLAAVAIGFALVIAAHWRAYRALPWPRLAAVPLLCAGLFGWALLATAWSAEARFGLGTASSLLGLLLLATMAARALAEDSADNLRRIGPALVGGLGLGAVLLGFDHASGNLFRLAVRGFPEWTERLTFGLKPAVSVVALLLPAVLVLPVVSRAASGVVLAAGLVVALWLPGESAKLAALAGVGTAAAAMLVPRMVARVMAAGLALLLLAAPVGFGLVLAQGPDLSRIPVTAAHRLLIWDFAITRIAEKPVLGWGMEASRSLPGSQDSFDAATLTRFGLTSAEERAMFGQATLRLPLHPHNGALHIWLETGAVGAALAAALLAMLALSAGRLAAAPAALGTLASGTVTGLLSFGIWQPWWIASVLLAAVLVCVLPGGRDGRG